MYVTCFSSPVETVALFLSHRRVRAAFESHITGSKRCRAFRTPLRVCVAEHAKLEVRERGKNKMSFQVGDTVETAGLTRRPND